MSQTTSSPELLTDLRLKPLTGDDWHKLKDVRLEALRESPMAFMARLEDEQRLSEAAWREMCEAGTWVVAEDGHRPVGVVRSHCPDPPPTTRYLESIRVAPEHRRSGVFSQMLGAIADLERRVGVVDLLLWVLEDNDAARMVYAAVGFTPTGERQWLRHLNCREIQLRRPIA